jgi:DNA-binding CsgD family transcriptional regulator
MPDGVVGRERELLATAEFLQALESGPAALVFEGEAGIGKTTLWREAAALAETSGLRVLSTRPAESEQRLSFAALTDLLEGIELELFRELPAPQRIAIEAALLRGGEGTPSDPRAVFAGVLSLLKILAAQGPTVVSVDDLQWLDPPSAHALQFVARRLGSQRIGLLVCSRLPEGNRAAELLSALEEEWTSRVQVGPLTLAATYQFLSERLGRAFSRPTLLRLQQASGGNPFYALEIARLLGSREPRPDEPLPVPRDVRGLVLRRIRRLPKGTRRALLAAAAASPPTASQLGGTLGLALTSGLVQELPNGSLAFTHPLYASAVYESASPEERREIHRQLAERVEDVEERAHHLAMATLKPDARVACELARAAERARARGAPGIAAELYEQARRLSDAREEQLAFAVDAAECHLQASDVEGARDLLAAAVPALPAGLLRARALWRQADAHLYQEDFPEALGLLERARVEASEDELAAEIELDLAYTHNAVGDMSAAGSHAREAVRLAAGVERPGLLAEALAVDSMAGCLLGRGVDWDRLERALALEDWERSSVVLVRPTLIAALLYSWSGALAEGRRLFDELHRQLLARGDEGGVIMGTFFRVAPDCWSGDIRGACRFSDELRERATLLGGDAMQAVALAAACIAHAYAGDAELVRGEAAEALETFARVGWALGRAWPTMALGMLELSLGNPAATDRLLSPLTAFMRTVGLAEPWGAAPFLPDAIEALLRLGRLQEADQLLNEYEASATRVDRAPALASGRRCRALLLVETGKAEAAMQAIAQALQQHERVPMPIERARTLLVKGQIERRLKKKAAAKESLESAVAIFDTLGAELWAARARTELSRVGLRPAAPDELSETEQRVAELAASGLTNREVAAQLFMSPKTVEANLARAYRKLGIRSRAELGARFGPEREPAQM